MHLNRYCTLAAALLAAAPFARAQGDPQAETPAPATNRVAHARPPAVLRRTSILYLACEGLALSDLSCYGQTHFQTPNLDRLAAGGMRFTNYRAVGEDHSQALAALMAGDARTGAPAPLTLAARLHQTGYRTGLVGVWTLGATPWTQGFDEFAGFLNEQEANNYYSDFLWRYASKGVFNPTNQTFDPWIGREEIHDNTGGRKTKFMPDLLLTAAANFVRINAPDFANHYRPFFLFVNLPAPRSVAPGKDEYPVPTDAPFTSEAWPQAAKNRAALLTRLDDGIGRLLEQLRKVDLTNNVAIFLSGDAAPEKFANTNLNFLQMKDEVRGGQSPERLRLPMLAYWPGQVSAGQVSRVPWSTPDFAPTALEIAFAPPATNAPGVSMVPALLGRPASPPPPAPTPRPGS